MTVDYRPTQTELYRLIVAWRASGPNVTKLFENEKDLAIAAWNVQSSLIATRGPCAKLICTPAPQNMRPDEPRFIAFGLFLSFLLNPFNERLGGPCTRCGEYYVKKNNRKASSYCSPKCGSRFTSQLTNRRNRQAEREKRGRSFKRPSINCPGPNQSCRGRIASQGAQAFRKPGLRGHCGRARFSSHHLNHCPDGSNGSRRVLTKRHGEIFDAQRPSIPPQRSARQNRSTAEERLRHSANQMSNRTHHGPQTATTDDNSGWRRH